MGAMVVVAWRASSAAHTPKAIKSIHLPELPEFEREVDVSTFQIGNLHAHSLVSDGDAHPKDVFLWYRDHGYNFVSLTDHNTRVDPKPYMQLTRPGFTILPGEEVTMTGAGRQVHVNGICTRETIAGGSFATAPLALRHAIDAIGAQRGVALVNHPNFDWGLTESDVVGATGAELLEIASGHPYVRTDGGQGHKSHEALWDAALTAGNRFAPAAVDDTHHYDPDVHPEKTAMPGRAFVGVFASRAEPDVLCDALRRGELYGSTGVKIERFVVTAHEMRVTPKKVPVKVEFVTRGGEIAKTVTLEIPGEAATYRAFGTEGYVRARVTAPSGKKALLPAYFFER